MARFDVLTAQRAIRDDPALDGPQVGLLLCATLRADNRGAEPGRVRASLELLAKDAKVSAKTAGRVFRDDRVLRYFSRVERQTRSVGLWFHATPDTESVVVPHDTGQRVRSHPTTPDSLSTTPDRESDHLPVPLSTASQPRAMDLDAMAEKLAETKGWPVDHCRDQLAAKRSQLQQRLSQPRAAMAVLRRIVTDGDPDDELQPPGGVLPPPPSGDLFGNFAAMKRTLHQCDKTTSGACTSPHAWEDARNFYHCQGA